MDQKNRLFLAVSWLYGLTSFHLDGILGFALTAFISSVFLYLGLPKRAVLVAYGSYGEKDKSLTSKSKEKRGVE